MKSAPIYFTHHVWSDIQSIQVICTCRPTYINRKLATHPHQLGGICLDLSGAAGVRLDGIDGVFPQLVDDLEVAGEGAGVLVVFRGDVGLDGVGEVDGVGSAEGDLEDVAALHLDNLMRRCARCSGVF